MHEFHTGRLPKPQFVTVSGQLDNIGRPNTAAVRNVFLFTTTFRQIYSFPLIYDN